MNTEQRLVSALRSAAVAPSEDLWSRVVHSIEEDAAHRRRVRRSVTSVAAALVAFVAVGALAIEDTPFGSEVRPGVMELLETAALVVLVLVLGPAIRRFGRGYAVDLWRSAPDAAGTLVRLLDVAYYLVFVGYVLVSAEFGTERGTVVTLRAGDPLAQQLADAAARIGGLLVIMGVLHALTFMILPVVALVANSTRVGRRLPRWLFVVLVVVGVFVAWQLIGLTIGVLVIGGSG